MARCNTDVLLNKIGVDKLDKTVEVTFSAQNRLPDCKKINAKDFVDVSGDYKFNKWRRPENRFECMPKGCVNTGTLFLEEANEVVKYRDYRDAIEYSNGIVTFYVKPDEEAELPAKITFKISDKEDMANADVYEYTIEEGRVTGDGYVPVAINLNADPASEEGTGWTPTHAGAFFTIEADKKVGVSSIAIFDTIDDFALNDVVKVGCLSTVGGTFDIEVVEQRCREAQYNDNVNQFSYTVTGNKVTPNYWKLNPLMGKGTKRIGSDDKTIEKVVERYEDGGNVYGRIVLPDALQCECAFIGVQIADDCNITDSMLTWISLPELMELDEGQFQVIKNVDGTTDLVVNAEHIGKTLKVSYPQAVEIEETIATTESLNDTRYRMKVKYTTSDGVEYVDIFDNVLITSFPATLTEEDTEFSFTIAILRDEEGVFMRRQRILAEAVSTDC